jgi:hypothetical protein
MIWNSTQVEVDFLKHLSINYEFVKNCYKGFLNPGCNVQILKKKAFLVWSIKDFSILTRGLEYGQIGIIILKPHVHKLRF